MEFESVKMFFEKSIWNKIVNSFFCLVFMKRKLWVILWYKLGVFWVI